MSEEKGLRLPLTPFFGKDPRFLARGSRDKGPALGKDPRFLDRGRYDKFDKRASSSIDARPLQPVRRVDPRVQKFDNYRINDKVYHNGSRVLSGAFPCNGFGKCGAFIDRLKILV